VRVWSRACVVCVVLLAATPWHAHGQQQVAVVNPDDQTFKRLSIEELSSIDVTSTLKHAEPISASAAAIQVITGDDIRRAGITTLPEALRLATGIQVARFDGRTWAISARGFNISTANKLVVLVDGRSVYTPLFSGVFWDVQDLVLEDVDRIEVIRGPGGTLWGANAVNGVINIVTKPAGQTRGTLVQIGGGSELGQAAVRYGMAAGTGGALRMYAKYRYRGSEVFETGASARDPLRTAQAGFRFDRGAANRTVMTLQGDLYKGAVGISDRPDSDVAGGNLLARIARTYSGGAQLQLQAYYDGTYRRVPRQFAEHRDTADIDLQYRTRLGLRHDLVAGAGYQLTHGHAAPSPVLFFAPETRTSPLVNLFVQDEITLVPNRVAIIIGSKVEHNDYTGFEYQPTVRARWTVRERGSVWGAVSRAVRMPTRFDSDLRFTGQSPIVVLRGDAGFRSETVLSRELGYRYRFGSAASIDVAAFHNTYDRLRTQEPTLPAGIPIVLRNNMEGRTSGLEASAEYEPAARVRLHAGYTLLSEDLRLKPGIVDIAQGAAEYNDPKHQVWMRSAIDLRGGFETDGVFRFVGELPHPRVPRYAELTLRLGWRRGRTELSLVGDNLLHDRHAEFGNLTPREEYPRSAFLQATWRY
jgi:iron complex outermembrane receptor protein